MAVNTRRFLSLLAVFVIFNSALIFAILYLVKQAENYKKNEQTKTVQQCSGLDLSGQCYNLERAETNQSRIKGLSDRDSLPEKSGMLFVFEHIDNQCFWMKDMKFNIDIVWLNHEKKITKIDKNISPSTYPNTFCADDTKYVLEFNSGFADKHGLIVGTTLKF